MRSTAFPPNVMRAMSACLMIACSPPAFETATRLPERARSADGVWVDPPAVRPRASAVAPARGVIALAPPLTDDALFGVVVAFLGSFSRRGVALVDLLAPDLVGIAPGPPAIRPTLVADWEQRMRQRDYGAVRATDLTRIEAMSRFSFDELDARSVPPRPREMRQGDVLVHVPLSAPIDPRSGERLFRDELYLMLRPDGTRLSIAGIAEVDAR